GDARLDARRHDYLVEAAARDGLSRRIRGEVDAHPEPVEEGGVVADGLGALILAGDALGDRELTADRVAGLEELDDVAALGERGRAGEAGRSGADDGDPLRAAHRGEDELGLVPGAGVDEAGRAGTGERVVEAGLVAG